MHQPLSTPYVCLLTWAQHELWTICLDAPREISEFALHLRHHWSPGFSAQTGVRVYLETAGSFAEIRKMLQEKTSEATIVQVDNQGLERMDNLAAQLGFIGKD